MIAEAEAGERQRPPSTCTGSSPASAFPWKLSGPGGRWGPRHAEAGEGQRLSEKRVDFSFWDKKQLVVFTHSHAWLQARLGASGVTGRVQQGKGRKLRRRHLSPHSHRALSGGGSLQCLRMRVWRIEQKRTHLSRKARAPSINGSVAANSNRRTLGFRGQGTEKMSFFWGLPGTPAPSNLHLPGVFALNFWVPGLWPSPSRLLWVLHQAVTL